MSMRLLAAELFTLLAASFALLPHPGVTYVQPGGGVITGRVLDHNGAPVVRAQVTAWRDLGERKPSTALPPMFEKYLPPRLLGNGTSRYTDDRGDFRLFGLPPGDYYVAADPPTESFDRRGSTPAGVNETTLVLTFFPGTRDVATAKVTTLRAGQEVGGVVIRMASAAMHTVSGTVVDGTGRPLTGASIQLGNLTTALLPGRPANSALTTVTGPDGRFVMSRVPAGTYGLSAMARFFGDFPEDPVSMLVTVTGDVAGLKAVIRDPRLPRPGSPFTLVTRFPMGWSFSGSRLLQGSDGNFYGTTGKRVFQITPSGAVTTVHEFTDAGYVGSLIQAHDGNFYGTRDSAGTGGAGNVFRMTRAGNVAIVHAFKGSDGARPLSLMQGRDGNFYGTTFQGGPTDHGTIFKIAADGTLTTLHAFPRTDRGSPDGGLIEARDGNFYGTTTTTVFKMTPDGTLTTLHTAANGGGGARPDDRLVEARDGSVYGSTRGGGVTGGTIFRMAQDGGVTTLHAFPVGTEVGPIVAARDGGMYGIATGGGPGSSVLFKITSETLFSIVHTFEGAAPDRTLLLARDGNLYGFASGGIFKIVLGGGAAGRR